jgi:hypothetical protein
MTDLLVLKAGGDYLRFRGDDHELTTLSHASVFPLSEAPRALQWREQLRGLGLATEVMQLKITENIFRG